MMSDSPKKKELLKKLDEIANNLNKDITKQKSGKGYDPYNPDWRPREGDKDLQEYGAGGGGGKGRPGEEQKGIPKDERTRLEEYLKYAQEYAYEGDSSSVEKAEGEILDIIKKYEPAGKESIIYAHYSGELKKLKKIASESAGLDDALRVKLNEENAGSLKELINRTQEKDKLQNLHSKLSMESLSDAQKITLGKRFQKRSKHFQDLSSITAGFEKVATKADEIQRLINEGTKIGDEAVKDRNPAKLDRATKIFRQAMDEADIVARQTGDPTEKDRYASQRFQAEQLLDRYTAVYEQLFRLFRDTEGIGRASVFTERHLKNVQDDHEFRRDDFQSLASLLNSYKVAPDEDKGKISNEIDALVGKIEKRHPQSKESLDIIKNNLHSDTDSAIYAASDESERAKKLGEATKDYRASGLTEKRRDTRDMIRGRAISGHAHWGSGGSAVVDAAEWIGFDRNPIETIGNLIATYLAWRIVVYGIVGPILDVFSFFIPFIGILKIPIYLIAIIILHPFMKTIIHPIKKDLHFLAGDPYWYKEGTAVDKVRSTAYEAGGAISEKVTKYNDADERRGWADRRKEQIGAHAKRGKEWAGRRKEQAGALRQKFRRNKTDDEDENEGEENN
ncbi:MAG: hypothetical protein KAT83_01230 [Candidatus Aenigmarchaeota archaeon]|nr:hypothetical protein [Candidatus Aenigmarchaeota archaeon]